MDRHSSGKSAKPIHKDCGGGFVRIENDPFPLPDGRPRFRCTKCNETWTEGIDGGASLRALEGKP